MSSDSNDAKKIRLKCRYNQNLRVVVISAGISFSQLRHRLKNDYGFDVSLKYEDCDGDLITLSSQNDLNDLLATENGTVIVHISQSDQQLSLIHGPTPVTPNIMRLEPLNATLPLRLGQAQSSIDNVDKYAVTANSKMPIRWQKGDMLGQGAFGTVYLGLNLDTGVLMAVKQLDTNEVSSKELSALEHEIKMLQTFNHPNIVRYLGTERTDDVLSIFLEYVPGGSAKQLLEKFKSPFDEAIVRTYIRQLLLGLEYLHRNGIAHRDIKGANVLVANDGTIKLADFGASKRMSSHSITGGMKGTPLWMAPEVIKQQGKAMEWKKSDIWSVGCTLIEMATGSPPWSEFSNPVTAMFHIACTEETPVLPEEFSEQARHFVDQCMQREPLMRPDVSHLLLHPFVSPSSMMGSMGEHQRSLLQSAAGKSRPATALLSGSKSRLSMALEAQSGRIETPLSDNDDDDSMRSPSSKMNHFPPLSQRSTNKRNSLSPSQMAKRKKRTKVKNKSPLSPSNGANDVDVLVVVHDDTDTAAVNDGGDDGIDKDAQSNTNTNDNDGPLSNSHNGKNVLSSPFDLGNTTDSAIDEEFKEKWKNCQVLSTIRPSSGLISDDDEDNMNTPILESTNNETTSTRVTQHHVFHDDDEDSIESFNSDTDVDEVEEVDEEHGDDDDDDDANGKKEYAKTQRLVEEETVAKEAYDSSTKNNKGDNASLIWDNDSSTSGELDLTLTKLPFDASAEASLLAADTEMLLNGDQNENESDDNSNKNKNKKNSGSPMHDNYGSNDETKLESESGTYIQLSNNNNNNEVEIESKVIHDDDNNDDNDDNDETVASETLSEEFSRLTTSVDKEDHIRSMSPSLAADEEVGNITAKPISKRHSNKHKSRHSGRRSEKRNSGRRKNKPHRPKSPQDSSSQVTKPTLISISKGSSPSPSNRHRGHNHNNPSRRLSPSVGLKHASLPSSEHESNNTKNRPFPQRSPIVNPNSLKHIESKEQQHHHHQHGKRKSSMPVAAAAESDVHSHNGNGSARHEQKSRIPAPKAGGWSKHSNSTNSPHPRSTSRSGSATSQLPTPKLHHLINDKDIPPHCSSAPLRPDSTEPYSANNIGVDTDAMCEGLRPLSARLIREAALQKLQQQTTNNNNNNKYPKTRYNNNINNNGMNNNNNTIFPNAIEEEDDYDDHDTYRAAYDNVMGKARQNSRKHSQLFELSPRSPLPDRKTSNNDVSPNNKHSGKRGVTRKTSRGSNLYTPSPSNTRLSPQHQHQHYQQQRTEREHHRREQREKERELRNAEREQLNSRETVGSASDSGGIVSLPIHGRSTPVHVRSMSRNSNLTDPESIRVPLSTRHGKAVRQTPVTLSPPDRILSRRRSREKNLMSSLSTSNATSHHHSFFKGPAGVVKSEHHHTIDPISTSRTGSYTYDTTDRIPSAGFPSSGGLVTPSNKSRSPRLSRLNSNNNNSNSNNNNNNNNSNHNQNDALNAEPISPMNSMQSNLSIDGRSVLIRSNTPSQLGTPGSSRFQKRNSFKSSKRQRKQMQSDFDRAPSVPSNLDGGNIRGSALHAVHAQTNSETISNPPSACSPPSGSSSNAKGHAFNPTSISKRMVAASPVRFQ